MPAPKLANLELTTRERAALAFYRSHVDEHGRPPTQRALAEHLGVYLSAAQYILRRLVDKRYLSRVSRPVTEYRLRLSPKGRKAPPPTG